MPESIPNVVEAATSTPWMIHPEKARQIANVLETATSRGALERFPEYREEARRQIEARRSDDRIYTGSARVRKFMDGRVAVVPIYGTISKRMNLMSAMSGGTSADKLSDAFRQLEADETVQKVILDVNSPGGSVEGVETATRALRSLTEEKGAESVTAIANDRMYSAAYYIASAAGSVQVTPSSGTGSIGTIAMLQEQSEALEEAGINVEVIRSTPEKGRPSGVEPFREEDLEKVQEGVNKYHDDFVEAVEINRNITREQALKLADGSTYDGTRVLDTLLADSESTLQDTLNKMAEDVSLEDELQAAEHEIARLEAELEGASDTIEEKEERIAQQDARITALEEKQKVEGIQAALDAALERGAISPAEEEGFRQVGQEMGLEHLEGMLDAREDGAAVPMGREVEEEPESDGEPSARGAAEAGGAPTTPEERKAYAAIPSLRERYGLRRDGSFREE